MRRFLFLVPAVERHNDWLSHPPSPRYLFTIHHSPFTIHHSPFAIRYSGLFTSWHALPGENKGTVHCTRLKCYITEIFPPSFRTGTRAVVTYGRNRDVRKLRGQSQQHELLPARTKTVTVQSHAEDEVHAIPNHDHQGETTDAAHGQAKAGQPTGGGMPGVPPGTPAA